MSEETQEAQAQEQPQNAAESQAESASLITDEKPGLDFSEGKPEGFPDDYWDAEKKAVNIDKLYSDFQNRDKIAKDLRAKLGRGEFTGKAPENVSEYALELSDELKAIAPDDDPLVAAAREAAKEAGVPKDVFSKLFTPIIGKIAEMRADAMKEPTQEEVDAYIREETRKLGPSGEKITSAIGAHLNGLVARGSLTENDAKLLKDSIRSAELAMAWNRLRMVNGGTESVPVSMDADAVASINEVQQKMAEAFRSGNQAEYDKWAAKLPRKTE